nr:anthranilate synthase component I [Oceanobacillus limi]
MGTKIPKQISLRVKEIEGDTLTPISIFYRLIGQKKFLLESSLKHEKNGRYSFIGCDPFLEVRGQGEVCHVHHITTNQTNTQPVTILEFLKHQLRTSIGDLPFPFYGGGVGYIGYDVIRQFEDIGEIPHDELQMPEFHLMFYEKIVIMDHQLQQVFIVVINLSGNLVDDRLNDEVIKVEQQLQKPSYKEFISEEVKTGPFSSNMTKEAYMEKVNLAKEYIKRGEIYQVVLSQRLQAAFQGSPFLFYRELRRSNPSPYMFYIDFDDYLLIGSSPESLTTVRGKHVLTNPIAGTRKRGATEKEDLAIEKELLTDEKELAEHRMLVDLGRNDLGKVCEVGSIQLRKYLTVERYKHVMHLVSEVEGKLRKNVSSLESLFACLPAGTVSGAPKIRAMQLINEMETTKRGVYSGGVGYLNINGDLDFALAIRTMVIKENNTYVQAGAGVVLDSVPEKEYEETLNKAKALLEVKK